MFTLMVVTFVLGYLVIALEHPLKIDKAATALIIGVLTWVLYMSGSFDIFTSGVSPAWNHFVTLHPSENTKEGMMRFITDHQILESLGEIAEILFFLLGAMTIVEIIDRHSGFEIITNRIKTLNKVRLLWVIGFLTFFMSAVLDNLTTTIVMIALLRKLIADKETRWFYAGMVVIAANSGGAFSPIGDVTTIMLWIGGQITAAKVITMVFLPSLVSTLVPVIILSFILKGNVEKPVSDRKNSGEETSARLKIAMLIMGISALLFVPIFKTITHLPPYMGMLLALGAMWTITEILHHGRKNKKKPHLQVTQILSRIDVPTVLFFLGILSAVSALQSAGHLTLMGNWLKDNIGNVYGINIAIGFLSSIVDNVPLVAGAMGMYPVNTPEMLYLAADPAYAAMFVQDGVFWEFLAYCAGTGGSILIIGSAAGVAAMGLEKIDFIWYLKKISWLALLGYLSGAGVYYLQSLMIH